LQEHKHKMLGDGNNFGKNGSNTYMKNPFPSDIIVKDYLE